MLPELNTIVEQHSNLTQNIEAEIPQFLDYAVTNPSAFSQYQYSDMILHIYSDASCLSEPKARSHTGGHYYPSLTPADPEKAPNFPPPENVPIHMECRILKHVVASAVKAEVGGMFHSEQTALPLYIKIEELGFPQSPTPIVL